MKIRSATYRKSFQSHIIVFFSKKNFFFENKVFSTYHTFFSKNKKKQYKTSKIVQHIIYLKNKQKNGLVNIRLFSKKIRILYDL